MREIKYRERIYDQDGNFLRFHYWGFFETSVKKFVSPVNPNKKELSEQYTGQYDKNGKEIYEGDICQSCYGRGKVFYDDRGFRFEFGLDTDGLWEMATGVEGDTFEIIGNIHKNPELLE
jgi:hypothetical protein